MAKTASISLSTASAQVNQRVKAQVTVSNGDASDVSVLSVTPLMESTGGGGKDFECNGALGVVPTSPGAVTTVPASGSLKLMFELIGQAPSANHNGANTFDVTCEVRLSDGSVIRPTPATLTVTPVPQFLA